MSQRKPLAALTLLAVGVGLFPQGTALAQTNTGRISGTVADTTSAVVPGATVTVTNDEKHLEAKATTDSAGYYLVINLPVGSYSVTVEAKGFRKAPRTGFAPDNAARITANFKLDVGGVSETVEVTAVVGETVNTVSGEIRHTIDSEQVECDRATHYMLIVSVPG